MYCTYCGKKSESEMCEECTPISHCDECGAELGEQDALGDTLLICKEHGSRDSHGSPSYCPRCGESLPLVDADSSGPMYGRCKTKRCL